MKVIELRVFHNGGYVYPKGQWQGQAIDEHNAGNAVTEFFINELDKNDKKVFEGDVVKAHWFYFDGNGEAEQEEIGTIVFEHGIFNVKFKDGTALFIHELSDEGLEVIGTVNENPELLEG